MTTHSEQPRDVLVQVYGQTDVGRSREHNEDSFLVADLSTGRIALDDQLVEHHLGSRGTLFMVADGLGGAASGEIASKMAVDVVLTEMRKRWVEIAANDPAAFAAALKGATETANARIHAYAVQHPEHRGMGTTATIAGLLGDTLYVVQIGDSRAYLLRNGVLQQISKDQSLMQRLVEAGEITIEEAEQSERRNIILQALGPEVAVKIDLTHQPVRRGDALVLCTDGLSGLIKRDDMARIATEEPDLSTACDMLVDLANENGGPDNITVVIARFAGGGLRRATDEDSVGHTVYSISGLMGVATPPHAMQRAGGPSAKATSGTPPRTIPALARGNTPYILAFVATLIVAIYLLLTKL